MIDGVMGNVMLRLFGIVWDKIEQVRIGWSNVRCHALPVTIGIVWDMI